MDGISLSESRIVGFVDVSAFAETGIIYIEVRMHSSGAFSGSVAGVPGTATMIGNASASFSIDFNQANEEDMIAGSMVGSMQFTGHGDLNGVNGTIQISGSDYQIHEGIPLDYSGTLRVK